MRENYDIRTPRDFASVLRETRVEQNMTQTELANAIGMTRRWVSDVERGNIMPGLNATLATLRALGLSMHLSPRNANQEYDLIAMALGER